MSISIEESDQTILGFAIFGLLIAAYFASLILIYIVSKIIDILRFRCFAHGSLRAKLIVVTGASTGIGKATAESFAKRGADVILMSRQLRKLEEVVAGIKKKFNHQG